jgi:transposase
MANRKYTDEFREEAVKQITERGYSVKEVSARLGVSTKSLYKWLGGVRGHRVAERASSLEAENARLKAELKRVEEERDILKKAAKYFARASG